MTLQRLAWLWSRIHQDDAAFGELLWKGALFGLVIGGLLVWLVRCAVELVMTAP